MTRLGWQVVGTWDSKWKLSAKLTGTYAISDLLQGPAAPPQEQGTHLTGTPQPCAADSIRQPRPSLLNSAQQRPAPSPPGTTLCTFPGSLWGDLSEDLELGGCSCAR